jgi:hypothetical protein
MDILQDLVKSLGKEELKSYKLFAKRTNDSDERRDILLFDSIKKHREKPDSYHSKLIYAIDKPDSKYYRLKSKVIDDIGSVLSHLYQKEDEINSVYLLQLAKIFKQKKVTHLSLHFLKLAEKKALKQEDFAALEAIYEEMIRINSIASDENPLYLIAQRSDNSKRLMLLQGLENNLAILSYQVKTTQNLTNHKEIKKWLNGILKTTLKHSYVKNSKLLRIKVFQNLSRIMMLLKDYESLETYLLTCWEEFKNDKLFNDKNHEIQLQLLIYLSNTSYLLGKHNQSVFYAGVLYTHLFDFNKHNFNQYIFYYYNILVNNFSKTDLQKAVETLEKAKEETSIRNNSDQYFYVLSNLAITLFDLKQYKQAGKVFTQIYISNGYKLLDVSVVFKIQVFELINRLEIGDYEVCLKQIQALNKLKQEVKNDEVIKMDVELVKILHNYINQDDPRWRPLKPIISNYVSRYESIENKTALLDYCQWLKTKY